MKAIIMAGGMGTRLKMVTGDTPKPMAMLAGRPVLAHILSLLRQNGISDVCISLRYRPQDIIDYFGDGEDFGVRICYNVEDTPLGTAGGVRACEHFYGEHDFLVISGDCACDFDLAPLFEAHRRHRAAVSIALHQNSEPLEYGTVLVNAKNEIVSFTEKPMWSRVVSDLVNTGIYVISPEAMAFVPREREFDFSKELFPALMQAGKTLVGLPLPGYWCDIGTPQAYYKCNLDALSGALKTEISKISAAKSADRPAPAFSGITHLFPCGDRAALMRNLSQNLMESGADFSDGITLSAAGGKVHISPSADQCAIRISAHGDTPGGEELLLQKYEALAKKLNEQSLLQP